MQNQPFAVLTALRILIEVLLYIMVRFSVFYLSLAALIGAGSCATQTGEAQAASADPQQVAQPQLRPASTAAHSEPAPVSAPTPSVATAALLTRAQKFKNWKKDFTNRAVARGYDAALVQRLIGPAKINEKALDRDKKQPEFTKPIWSYVDGAASADRLNKGRSKLESTSTTYNAIENKYRVSRHYLTAIWGLESAYGAIQGNHNIVDSFATFAHDGRRMKFGEQQLFAVLDLISRGDLRIDQLKGSWAGAIGMPQFIPTTMRDYAVDFDNNANIDLRGSKADALGSAAHYLSRHGWRWGEPAMAEVALPKSFDYTLAEGAKKSVNDWTVLGVRPANGSRWSNEAGFLEGKLIVPAGHKGPKFLTFKNFDVIKKYNNSTSYAMGITVLAESLRGQPAITTPWPRGDKQISFTQKKQLQSRLTQLGYDTKGVDGQIGPNSRRAIRAWQKANGLIADGYVDVAMWNRIMAR